MKIEKIYVAGFGKLKDKTYNLNDLNEIIKENGSGKTTLATFIQCAFYGIDASSKDLRRYMPWDNSTFGGYIVFDTQGKKYKLQRTFGAKKSEDTFVLFNANTNQTVRDFSENIGEELFGLDRKAFLSSCLFCLDTDFAFNSNAVYKRLNTILTNSSELEDYDKKISVLEKSLKEYENAQHKGLIPSLRQKIENVKDKITKLLSTPSLYDSAIDEKKELNSRLNKIKEEILAQEKVIEGQIFNSAKSSKHAQINFLKTQQLKLSEQLQKEQAVLNGQHLSNEQLDNLINLKQELSVLKKESNNLQNELAFLNCAVEQPLPSAMELEKRKQTYSTLQTAKMQKQAKTSQLKVNKALGVLLLLFAVALVAISIYFAKSNFIITVVLAIIAIAFTVVAIITFIKNPLKQLTDKISTLNAEVNEFLTTYNYGGYDFASALPLIESEYNYDQTKIQKSAELKRAIAETTAKINSINERIAGFLSKFNLNSFKEDAFTVLENTVKNIDFLKGKLNDIDKQLYQATQTVNQNYDDLLEKEKLIKQDLTYQKEQLEEKLNACNTNLINLKNNLSQISEHKKELYVLEQELKTLLHEKQIVFYTIECITEAKNNLTNGSLSPICQSLNLYLGKLFKHYKNFTVDENFLVTYEFGGIVRDFNSLSLGEKQLVFLCLRIGLINAMFKKEKPFLILDDAFAPLDEENLILARELLKEISSQIQIIYLAPTPNRKIQ